MSKDKVLPIEHKQLEELVAEKDRIQQAIKEKENEIIEKYSPYNRGDKIRFKTWYKREEDPWQNAIIDRVWFDVEKGFRFLVDVYTKKWKKDQRSRSVVLKPFRDDDPDKIQALKDIFGNLTPVKIEEDEWWFNGRIIQRQIDKRLPDWISFPDDGSNKTEIHADWAKDYCLENPCRKPDHLAKDYL